MNLIKLTYTDEDGKCRSICVDRDSIVSIQECRMFSAPCTEINVCGDLHFVQETPEQIMSMMPDSIRETGFLKLTSLNDKMQSCTLYLKKDIITSMRENENFHPACTEINAYGKLYLVKESTDQLMNMLEKPKQVPILPVKMKLTDYGYMPEYETDGAVGMDIRSPIRVLIRPGERVHIKSGVCIELPSGYEVQVRSRSGMAESGISVTGGVGTIDSDYRGEIGIALTNTNIDGLPIEIKEGSRVAQIVFTPIIKAKLLSVKELSKTERGNGGFGHTGME